MKLLGWLLAPTLLVAATVPTVGQEQDQHPLEGVWRVAEITTITADGETGNSKPQPGLFIFTRGHYSAIWTPGSQPRPPYADTWRPTGEEKIRAYDSIIVNAGTYESTESRIVTRPILARVPGFGGGKAIYEYELDGDELSLEKVEEYSRDGVRLTSLDHNRLPLKLVRVE